MSLLAKCCKELKKENEELKKDNEELQRENGNLKGYSEELQRENGNLKGDNKELMEDNGELKRENEEMTTFNSVMKQQLVNVHHTMVGNSLPLLPITVSRKEGGYFYSKPFGHLMSFEVNDMQKKHNLIEYSINIKVYNGQFQNSLVSEIIIKCSDIEQGRIITTTRIINKNYCIYVNNDAIQTFDIILYGINFVIDEVY
jgi:FtsZ-binding cell division protein ZapB